MTPQHEVTPTFAAAILSADHEAAAEIDNAIARAPDTCEWHARKSVYRLLREMGFHETLAAWGRAMDKEMPF